MAKGEGSKGGHVIGHTKSGKPIYGDHASKVDAGKGQARHPDQPNSAPQHTYHPTQADAIGFSVALGADVANDIFKTKAAKRADLATSYENMGKMEHVTAASMREHGLAGAAERQFRGNSHLKQAGMEAEKAISYAKKSGLAGKIAIAGVAIGTAGLVVNAYRANKSGKYANEIASAKSKAEEKKKK